MRTKPYTRQQTIHKMRMQQRRFDQWNRKEGYHTTINPLNERKWLRGLQLLNGYATKLNQRDYEGYHTEQRQRLQHFIKQALN